MRIIELILDEEAAVNGVNAISIVEHPAIESDFIALSAQHEVKFEQINAEKRLLLGAALIPNKTIYRSNGEDEYYVYFASETIRKASELFFKVGNQAESTLEHMMKINGLTVVESWIVEDSEKDKSAFYSMKMPVGTWMVAIKVDNEDIWHNYVKTGKVKGFSIEGYFSEKTYLQAVKRQFEDDDVLNDIMNEEREFLLGKIKAIVKRDARTKSGKRTELESFADYPDSVKNNAKRGIELNEKINNRCATQVGKIRAQQLANGEPISVETIQRMYSYLSRAEEYYVEGDIESCGTISYLLWGGLSAKNWSESKLKEIGKL